MLKRGKLSLEGESGRVTTSGIVENDRFSGSGLSECGGKVQGDTNATKFLVRLRAAMDDTSRDAPKERNKKSVSK